MKIDFLHSMIMLITITVSVECSLNVTCPMNCTCSVHEHPPSLDIECQQREEDIDDVLGSEINVILANMSQLTLLNISHTSLTRVPVELCKLRALRSLYLDHNQIQRLPDDCLSRLEHLQVFTAIYNNISQLQDGLFDGLNDLEGIALAHNNIDSIGLSLFTNSTDLPNLSYIQLDHNRLTELQPWPFIRALAMPNITVVLSNNFITKFSNSINWNSTCQDALTPSRKTKMTLYLNSNRISNIASLVTDLNFNSVIDVLCWLNEVNLKLGHCPYVCDCLDYTLHALDKVVNLAKCLDGVYCIDKYTFQNVRARFVPLENLVCSVPEQCPAGCSCVNQPSNCTFHVMCKNSGMNNLPSSIPNSTLPTSLLMPTRKNVYKLCFSYNNISHLGSRDFFQDTVYLDLSHSQLVSISETAWLQLGSIDKIYLHNNLLTIVPSVANFSNLSFSTLSLYNNPLSCSCDQLWMKSWLSSIYDRLENPSAILCNSPLHLKGRNIFTIPDTEFCSNSNAQIDNNVWVIIVVASILIAALFVVIFVKIKQFRVKVFSSWGVHPFDRNEFEGEEMDYDVFLVYADEDNTRATEILHFLESKSCKVFCVQRDFLYGSVLLESMLDAVYKSKRVLCLVSEHFLSSDVCMTAFDVALCRSLALKRRHILVMKSRAFRFPVDIGSGQYQRIGGRECLLAFEPFSTNEDESSSFPFQDEMMSKRVTSLKNFIARHTCISCESETWQQQLLYAMPVNRIHANEAQVDTSVQTSSTTNDDRESMLNPNEDIDDPSSNFRDTHEDVPLLNV